MKHVSNYHWFLKMTVKHALCIFILQFYFQLTLIVHLRCHCKVSVPHVNVSQPLLIHLLPNDNVSVHIYTIMRELISL